MAIAYTYDEQSQDFELDASFQHNYNGRRGQAPDNFSNLLTVAHSAWPSTNGNHLFGTDERNGFDLQDDFQLSAYLRTWDISDLDATPDGNGYRNDIQKVYQVKEDSEEGAGEFEDSYFDELSGGELGTSIHNVHVRNESGDDIAYMSYYTEGLRILDGTVASNFAFLKFC